LRLISLIFIMLLPIVASAQTKSSLVDEILTTSSIKVSIDSLPSQLSQFPALLPIEGKNKAQLSESFLNELSIGFNEAYALNYIRNFLVANGNEAYLQQTLAWLNTEAGQAVTQVELLANSSDPAELQHYVSMFDVNTCDQQRLKLLNNIIAQSEVSDLMFKMLERMMDPMLPAIARDYEKDVVESHKLMEFKQKFSLQMQMMEGQVKPVLAQKMLAAYAFAYRDLSVADLQRYSEFVSTPAGKHYVTLANEAIINVSVDWVIQAIPNIVNVQRPQHAAVEE